MMQYNAVQAQVSTGISIGKGIKQNTRTTIETDDTISIGVKVI
jgi:hypothetical protein